MYHAGIHELCSLTSKHVCPPNQHLACVAAQFISAYNYLKVTMMVGNVRRHTPVATEIETGALSTFAVTKVNRNGYKQLRMLAVDVKRCTLLNFSKKMELKKTLSLDRLVQIEKSVTDPRVLALVFTSTGVFACGIA